MKIKIFELNEDNAAECAGRLGSLFAELEEKYDTDFIATLAALSRMRVNNLDGIDRELVLVASRHLEQRFLAIAEQIEKTENEQTEDAKAN